MDIRINNLAFKYRGIGAASKNALDDLNLEIRTGEFLALIGPSGSGKTTLMQHLTGLLKPDSGTIFIDGKDLWARGGSQTDIRRRIGLVFQFPESQLFEESVFDDVAFGARNLGLSNEDVRTRVVEAMVAVGLDFDQFQARVPFHLSDGEKRRAAIAGTLAMRPQVLVLDEPTAGLDKTGVDAVVSTLVQFHGQGNSVLLISHDLDLVLSLVDRVALISAGKIVFDGNKKELLGNEQILQSVGMPVPRMRSFVSHLRNLKWLDSEEVYTVSEVKRALKNGLKQHMSVCDPGSIS